MSQDANKTLLFRTIKSCARDLVLVFNLSDKFSNARPISTELAISLSNDMSGISNTGFNARDVANIRETQDRLVRTLQEANAPERLKAPVEMVNQLMNLFHENGSLKEHVWKRRTFRTLDDAMDSLVSCHDFVLRMVSSRVDIPATVTDELKTAALGVTVRGPITDIEVRGTERFSMAIRFVPTWFSAIYCPTELVQRLINNPVGTDFQNIPQPLCEFRFATRDFNILRGQMIRPETHATALQWLRNAGVRRIVFLGNTDDWHIKLTEIAQQQFGIEYAVLSVKPIRMWPWELLNAVLPIDTIREGPRDLHEVVLRFDDLVQNNAENQRVYVTSCDDSKTTAKVLAAWKLYTGASLRDALACEAREDELRDGLDKYNDHLYIFGRRAEKLE